MAVVETVGRLDLGTEDYKLLKVPPAKLPEFWPQAKQAIARSLPEDTTVDEVSLGGIMEKLMTGEMDLWLLVKNKEGEAPSVEVAIVLAFVVQLGHEAYKNLLIYSLASFSDHIADKTWMRVWEALKEYGRMTGCKKLSMVSKDPRLLDLAARLLPEVDLSMRVINVELKE